MAKGFWITFYRSISDPAALAAYGKLAGPAIIANGGRFLARGEAVKAYEQGIVQRATVTEFEAASNRRRRPQQSRLSRGIEGTRQCMRTGHSYCRRGGLMRIRLLAEFPTVWFESVGHPNQLGIGSRAHFVHGRTSMNFDRDFADPKVAGHLLVHFAGSNEQHHLLFARRKSFESLFQLRIIILDNPSLSIALDGSQNGIKHVLIAKWLGEEIYSTMLHCVNGHRNVSVPGHHHHRNSDADLDQSGLKLKAVHVW
jgi:uncharacterized protein (DUF1330 family)